MSTNNADVLDILEAFAFTHANDPAAGIALMSFLRGECDHRFRDEAGDCELCGDES